MDYEHGLWIMALREKELGRGPGLWHMDYASAWEDNLDYGLWIMALEQNGWEEDLDYGTWIMQVPGKRKPGLWIMDLSLIHI